MKTRQSVKHNRLYVGWDSDLVTPRNCHPDYYPQLIEERMWVVCSASNGSFVEREPRGFHPLFVDDCMIVFMQAFIAESDICENVLI